MKKIALLTLVSLVSFSVFAQDKNRDSKGDRGLAFGIKGGITFPAFAISGAHASNITSSSLTSFYAGIKVNMPIISVLSVQPGLSLIGKGTSLNSGNTTTKLTPLYLEIPVNLVAWIPAGPGKFFIGAGPYWALGLFGNVKTTGQANTSIKFGSDDTKDLKMYDYGINFLFGYQLRNGLSIDTGYGLGLRNIQPNSTIDETYKSGVFSLGLGFSF